MSWQTAVGLLAIGLGLAAAEPIAAQDRQGGMGMGGMGMGGMGMGGMGVGGMGHGYSWYHNGPGMHFGWYGGGPGGTCFMSAGENGAFANLDARLEFLRANIGVNDAQRAAWDAYTAAVKRSIETMQTAYQVMMQNMMNLNFAERFNAQLGAMNAHMAELQKVAPALAGLYGVLTPEQKQKADTLFRAMGCYW